jgi:hypothetical protein
MQPKQGTGAAFVPAGLAPLKLSQFGFIYFIRQSATLIKGQRGQTIFLGIFGLAVGREISKGSDHIFGYFRACGGEGNIELDTPTIAQEMPRKTIWRMGTGEASQSRHQIVAPFIVLALRELWSRLRTLLKRRKDRLHQTEHPNALPAS